MFHAGLLALRGILFRVESLAFALANPQKARTDAVLLAAHYAVWLVVPSVIVGPLAALAGYLGIALLAGPCVGMVLTLNHEGMSKVSDYAAAPVLSRVLATTRNLRPSALVNVALGGINNHIEHHLFPRIPASRLPRARAITQAFCRDRELPYAEAGFAEALGASIRHFTGESRERLAVAALP